LQWLQDPSEINGDNLNTIRCEASRHFKNSNKNIKDLYKGINELKSGYQPRSNLVKDENGDLLARVSDVRQKHYSWVDST
jgi:hypothetical protein